VLLRTPKNNRINGPPEDLACLIENIRKQIQNIPTRSQRILQHVNDLVFLRSGTAYRKADEMLLPGLLLLKLPDSLAPFHAR